MQKVQQELIARIKALNTSAYVYEIDIQGNIVYVNEALLKITQYLQEELLGQKFTILRSGRQPDKLYRELIERVRKGKIWKAELEKRSKTGQYFAYLA